MPMAIGVFPRRFLSRLISGCFARVLLLLLSGWASGCTPLILTPTPVAPLAEPVDVRLIVQVTYPTVAVLNALASELDIWEVNRTAQTLVARVTLEQYDELRQQELPVNLDCAKMRQYEQQRSLALPVVAQLMQEQCPQNKP